MRSDLPPPHLRGGVGSFNPAEWCILIELLADLANDIMNNPFWNHKTTQATQPLPNSIPKPILQPDSIPFGPALPVDVKLNLSRHVWVDGYIDDIITVMLDIKNG